MKSLSALCATVVAFVATQADATAQIQTWYANAVPPVPNWNNEASATGQPPNNDCNQSNPDYASASSGSNLLVGQFPNNIDIPAGQTIANITIGALCRYDMNEAAECRVSASWPGGTAGQNFVLNSGSGNCGWRNVDITNQANWTNALLDGLEVRIRRQPNTNPNNTLRCKAFRVEILFAPDCNGNGIPDDMEPDCDNDGIPDDCEPDCDNDGVPDDCESDCDNDGIPDDCEPDCDNDGTPDDCEQDCDNDGIPDDCEPDCDNDGTPDDCEPDCDNDGIPDDCEPDCDNDGLPDDCDGPDCNNNGLPDNCDLASGNSQDCNGNNIPDECDIASGLSADCNNNGIPDECEPQDCDGDGIPDACEVDCDADGVPDDCQIGPDCNGNGVPDSCDIATGMSQDIDGNGIPDECEDCNGNGVGDALDIQNGTSQDCNGNGVPDECDLDFGTSQDCDGNGIPDECDIASGLYEDCNTNGVPDTCEIAMDEDVFDCNGNGVLDSCEIAQKPDLDGDGDGVLDSCGAVFCFCDAGSVCLQSDPTAGCPNSTSFGGSIATAGSSSITSSELSITISSLPPGQSGIVFMGSSTTLLPFGDGLRCVGGSIFRYPIGNSGGLGSITYPDIIGFANSSFPPTGQFDAGDTWYFQGWYRDPNGPCGTGFNVTNATTVVFLP